MLPDISLQHAYTLTLSATLADGTIHCLTAHAEVCSSPRLRSGSVFSPPPVRAAARACRPQPLLGELCAHSRLRVCGDRVSIDVSDDPLEFFMRAQELEVEDAAEAKVC